jgi:release factor glutamine methyltransferase
MRAPPGPTRREVVDGIAAELQAAGVESPRLEAERLVCHVLGVERHELASSLSSSLRPEDAGSLARAVKRRIAGEPLQHIEGSVEFRDLVLQADRRALVPRPETEQLVDEIARWARSRGSPSASTGVRIVRRPGAVREPLVEYALDIGVGGGAIALSLVQERIARRVVGIDTSPEALAQAGENRAAVGLGESVELRLARGSPWSALEPGESFDLIVSNPPYIPSGLITRLGVEVREHEPREALDGGADGLDVARIVAAGAPGRLRPGGALFLEIGEDQGTEVRSLLERSGCWTRVEIRRDLCGRQRFVVALK